MVVAGDRIGSYLVEEQLGEGGYAQVVRARHHLLDRTVALKVLRGHAGRDRFIREAQILARLNRGQRDRRRRDQPRLARPADMAGGAWSAP